MVAKKDIKFTQVKKQAKEVHKTETYEINETNSVTFNPIFAQTEIDKLYENLQHAFRSVEEEVFDEIMTDSIHQKFVMFHMIKQFTHFKSQLKATDLVGQLMEMEALIDMEIDGKSLFTTIITEVFSLDQVSKVFDGLSQATSQMMFIQDFEQKTQQKLQELKNKSEVANVLNNLN